MWIHITRIGMVFGVALLAAGCVRAETGGTPANGHGAASPSPLQSISKYGPIAGVWVVYGDPRNEYATEKRTMEVSDDGAISANLGWPCSGKATHTRERSYRIELDCGLAKLAGEATVHSGGNQLTIRTAGNEELWCRQAAACDVPPAR